MNHEIKKVFLFALVGIINTAVGLSAIYTFRIFTKSEILANIMGYSMGLCTSYYLNGKVTFKTQIRDFRAILRFFFAFIIAWLTNIAVVLFMIDMKVPPHVAHLAGMPVFTVIFYLLSRFYVFRNSPKLANASKWVESS